MVEYGSGRGWPRRSAYDNFDEDSWMDGVRERLRSALYTPTEPRKTVVQLKELSESEHTEEEDEIQEDPSAKNHVRLTSEAMQELFALGGVVDQESGSSVRLDDFAERVWRVDQPQDSNSASSLFQAFHDGSSSDIDAILRHRMRTEPQKELAGAEDRIQRTLIQEIPMQSPEHSETEDSDIAASQASSSEDLQVSETDQESTSEALSSSQSDSVSEEPENNVSSDELAERDEMQEGLEEDGSDIEDANVSVAEYESSQQNSSSMNEDFDAHSDKEAEESQYASRDTRMLQVDNYTGEQEASSLPFDSYRRENGYCDSEQPELDSSFDASALDPGSYVASQGQKTDPIQVLSESEEELAEGERPDTTHDSIDVQAESMEDVRENDEAAEENADSEYSQGAVISNIRSNKEDDGHCNPLESLVQAINGNSGVIQPFQHEPPPTGEQHLDDHHISADAVEIEINEKRKAALASLSGKAALRNQESSVNEEFSLQTTHHPQDDLATDMPSPPRSGSHNAVDAGDLTQYTQDFPELANLLDHNASENQDPYILSTDQSHQSQKNPSSHIENAGDDANQLYDLAKTDSFVERTSTEAPSPDKSDMGYEYRNLDSQDETQAKQQSSQEDATEGPLPDFPEGAWRAFVSDGTSAYDFAAASQDANAINSKHPASIAPLVHSSEPRDELRQENQNGHMANLPNVVDPSTFDTRRGVNTDPMRDQDPRATIQLTSEDTKGKEDITHEQKPATTDNDEQTLAHVGATDKNDPYRFEGEAELEQQPSLEDHSLQQESTADFDPSLRLGSSSPIRIDSDSIHPGQDDVSFKTNGQRKQSDSSSEPNLQASPPSSGLLSKEEQETRTEPHRTHFPITRSHCHSQRLILLRETGSPAFIVPSCVLDPEVLAKEGAEKQDVNVDQLDLVTLNPDALPESVYHTLCRIVSPSLLDEVSVTPDSHAASWMIDDVRQEQSDASSEKDDEQLSSAHAKESGSVDSSTGAFNTSQRAATRGHRRPRKSDSSSGIANYIPPDHPDRSRADSPADVSIEELEQLPTIQPKRARTSSPAPRMRLRRADERRPTRRYSPGP